MQASTIPETVTMVFTRSGAIKPSSGATVTIAGTVEAGRWRVFDRTLGGTVTFASTAPIKDTFPEWWGAVGNGTTTDHAALLAALSASVACNATLTGRPSAVYAIAANITLATNTKWDLGGSIVRQVINTTASPLISLASGVRLSNGTVDTNSLATGTAVLASGVSDFRIERMKFTDASRTVANCVQVTGASSDGWVEECVIDGAIVGIRVTGTSRGIHVLKNITRNTKDRAIYVVGATGASPQEVEVVGNDCREADSSGTVRTYIQASGVSGTRLKNITIHENTCVGLGLSHTATPAGTADQITCTHVDGLVLADNVSVYGGDVGISGTLNTGEVVTGNLCAFNDTCGIAVGSTAGAVQGATVTGNACMNNGLNRNADRPAWARVGINLWAVQGGVVTGNVFADVQTVPTQQYGMSYKNSSALRFGQQAYFGNVLAKELDDGGNTDTGTIFDSGVTVAAGSTTIKKHLRLTTTLDFPSIAAHTTAELTVAVTGAVVGDKATAHPNSAPEPGLTFGGAYVSAANTVTVRVANVTAAAIDPANRTWHVLVWGH